MSDRAVPHVRKFLGQRLRELRKQRGLSQERLGDGSSRSGKFIGEVERSEKSISIDGWRERGHDRGGDRNVSPIRKIAPSAEFVGSFRLG